MNQTQLLAIDTVLPTILGLGGLIFVAAALWPIGREWPKRDRLAGSIIGVVGICCLGAAVWLWLLLFGSVTKVVDLAPGTSVMTVVSVPPAAAQQKPAAPVASTSPSAAESASAAASGSPATSAAGSSSPSASAAPPSLASPSVASPSTSAAVSRPPSITPSAPTPVPSISLAPVPAVAFQPDTAPPHGLTVAVQSFEHGFMIFRADTKQIYVLTDDKKFKVYPDTWDESQPDLGSTTPVDGKYRPGRGFGKLWNANSDVKQGLGLALTPEQGLTARVSSDPNTVTLQADANYVFNKDGTWSIK